MINIIYLDDEIFNMTDGTKEDIYDLWESDLDDISEEFELNIYDNPADTLKKIKELGNNTILILDMNMGDTTGAQFLKTLRNENITIPVIAYTAYENNDMHMDLLQNDIFSYVKKAGNDYKELITSIDKAIEKFKDNIPLELGEALDEYLERHSDLKDSKVVIKEDKEVTFSEIQEEMNKGTALGRDYQKAIYKIAFEDLRKGE